MAFFTPAADMLLPGALAYAEHAIFGRKKKKKMSGIVKQTTRSGGKTQIRMTDITGFKSRKRNRSVDEMAALGRDISLSGAQKAAQSFTQQERETKKDDEKMSFSHLGTLGRKYKPKFKEVPITARTSRLRYVHHRQVSSTKAVYVGFNDVGPVFHMYRCLAEALLLHYMSRAGQHPVVASWAVEGPNVNNTDNDQSTLATWKTMRFRWSRPYETADEVFDDVNQYTQTSNVGLTHITFEQMANGLTSIIHSRTKAGYELSSVSIFRGDAYQAGSDTYSTHRDAPIMHDPDAGRHMFCFTAKAKYKVQNTTAADTSDDQHNKDNIHANPLDGLVYKFRNRCPQFAHGWLAAVDNSTTTEALNQAYNTQTDNPEGCLIPENLSELVPTTFDVPPPAPYTVFKNSAGRSKILIKPGEHRVLKLTEGFEGTVNAFLKKYTPIFYNGAITIPPGGNCLMIGLKPTFRTGTNEDLQVQTETDRYFAGLIKKRKLTSMPITNILS